MCKVLKCNHLGSIHSSNKIALPLQWCKFRGSLSSKQKCQVILEGSNKELLCRYKVICISYQCYILHIITINPGCTQFFLESSRGHVLCPMFSGAFSTKHLRELWAQAKSFVLVPGPKCFGCSMVENIIDYSIWLDNSHMSYQKKRQPALWNLLPFCCKVPSDHRQ